MVDAACEAPSSAPPSSDSAPPNPSSASPARLRELMGAVGLEALLDRVGPEGRLGPGEGEEEEGGEVLTAGELQRVGLARVLYRCVCVCVSVFVSVSVCVCLCLCLCLLCQYGRIRVRIRAKNQLQVFDCFSCPYLFMGRL